MIFKTKYIQDNKSGFTLIELLVAISIFSIALLVFAKILNLDFISRDVSYKVMQNFYGSAEVSMDEEGGKQIKLQDKVAPMTLDITNDSRINDLPVGNYSLKSSILILKDPTNPEDFTKDKVVKVLLKSD